MRRGFHTLRDGAVLTLARRVPVRFDVAASTRLPDARRGRVAHQVRQDLWRNLQSLRGFSPVVRVIRQADGLLVEAGGQVDGAIPRGTEARIADLLADPQRRARWMAHARCP